MNMIKAIGAESPVLLAIITDLVCVCVCACVRVCVCACVYHRCSSLSSQTWFNAAQVAFNLTVVKSSVVKSCVVTSSMAKSM